MFGAAAGRDKRIFHREFKRACSFSVKKAFYAPTGWARPQISTR